MTAVDLIIGIAKRLTEAEIEELILPKFQELAGKISENVLAHLWKANLHLLAKKRFYLL